MDKMIRAGMLGTPIKMDAVDRLSGREHLLVTDGELTVLRTGARSPSDPLKYPMENRQWMGFHVEHSNKELEESSLRWWRCDPERVVDNELLAVTVATYPVAVYRIRNRTQTIVPPGEHTPRHMFSGQLLARAYPGMTAQFHQGTPGHLRNLANQIMISRITVHSGGPIGYLEARS